VLPGPEQACPPFQQKYTAIWQNTPLIHIFKKFRYFCAISRHFPHINFKIQNTRSFSLISTVLSLLRAQIRLFSATFG
jgi:hypothetical protein